jgi:cytochrome c-type biogenesis protein
MIDFFSAFLLGLVIIIHPCTAAPNVAAMTYIYGKSDRRPTVLWMFVLGHTLLYAVLGTVVALLVRTGVIVVSRQTEMQWAVPLLAGIFFVAGLLLIYSSLSSHHHHAVPRTRLLSGTWGAFFSGVLLALAFCPEAAVAFFGVLIPMSAASASGLLLPLVFAAATAIPLAAVAVLFSRGKTLNLAYLSATRWFNLVLGIFFLVTAAIVWLF